MKILGVIMECNPLHNGHSYFIKKAKELCHADYCVAVISGDYVQRGCPALFGKEFRTEALLKNGADLVLELPVAFSTGSAEYFARAGVALLDKLGCIDYLCFGSECGEIDLFQKAAKVLTDITFSQDSSSYRQLLSKLLKEGKSYPTARYEALASIPACHELLALLETPNNILGLEYCQALLLRNSTIKPLTFKREGAGYHDLSDDTDFASASGIRKAMMNAPKKAAFLKHIPENCHSLYTHALSLNQFVSEDDFSLLLAKQILFSDAEKLASYQDVTMDFAQKLCTLGTKHSSFTSYCDAMKSKNYTYTRISRSLLHILLEITKESVEKQVAMDYVSYARILGFRKDSSELLSRIKECSSIPVLSKLADAQKSLSPEGFAQLWQTLSASHLYNVILAQKTGSDMIHEYSKKIIIHE